MYCRKCGTELQLNAKFCAKCGTKVMDAPLPEESVNPLGVEMQPPFNVAQGINGGSIHLVEGALSVLLAIMALFLPVVRAVYDTGYSTTSMLHVVFNLSRFKFPGKYAPIGPMLGILMFCASIGSLLNAKQAFANELPGSRSVAEGITVSNSYASLVTVYAIALIVLLGIAGGHAYGIAGCSGWAWVLLFGGVACQVVHFARWFLNAQRVG